MRRPRETTPRWLGRVFLAVALAYGVAAIAGSTVMLLVIGIAFGEQSGLAILPLTVPVVALFALPGFLVLRPLLYFLGSERVVWFAAGGALVALVPTLLQVLVRGPASLPGDGLMLAALGMAGATAGACYRRVERTAFLDEEAVT